MSNEHSASSLRNWRKLAEQASAEPDSEKLMETIRELCMELDNVRQNPVRPTQVQKDSGDDQSGLSEPEKTA